MKTQEELNALKKEIETLNKKLKELTEEELALVVGGAGGTGNDSSTGTCLIINCDYVNIRDAAGGGAVIGKIKCGTRVTYLGKVGCWGHIIYNGIEGYIYKDYYTL